MKFSETDTPDPASSHPNTGHGELRLRLENVSKSFGVVRALDNVSLFVEPGQVHGLIGENGAGKSTLMAIASGGLSPDSGVIAVNGVTIEGDAVAARESGLGIVHQHPALLPELSVIDNLLLGVPRRLHPPTSQRLEWARECLLGWGDRPDIDPRLRVSMLNPEQRFVVEMCRALAQNPSVLILDEPSEHLGADGVEHLIGIVRQFAAGGAGVVYISHRLDEVRRVSDVITALRDGVIRGTRAVEDVDENEIVKMVVGRSLESNFPPKRSTSGAPVDPVLVVEDFSGPRFRDVSFTIEPGEIVGLAGIDGNGQAEIAAAIAGNGRSEGSLRVRGTSVVPTSTAVASQAGVVYIPADRQKEGIFQGLSVLDNAVVRVLGSLSRLGVIFGSRTRGAAEDIVTDYSVKTPSTETAIENLSGGNQQKVLIGAAIQTSPAVLVADQPTQGVDVGAKVEIYSHLRRISEGGAGVLAVSSSNAELAGLCDRVLVVSRGQVVAELTGDQLSEETITDAVLRADSERTHVRRSPKVWNRLVDSDWAPVPILLVLIAALAIVAQLNNVNYLSSRNIGTVLALTATLAVVSYGQSLTMLRGGIDLSVGALMSMVVVVASYYVIDGVGFGYQALGWGLIALMCLGVGLVNWALIDRLRIHPILATLGTWMLLEAVALMLRPVPGGLIAGQVVMSLAERVGPIPLAFIGAFLLAIGVEYWRRRTRSGLNVQAVGSSEKIARTLGVSDIRATITAYVGSSLLAGLAGVLLIGQVGSGDATAGSLYTLQSVAAAVVGGVSLFGGRGSIVSVLVAALLLTQVRAITTFLSLNDAWQSILLAIVTIGAVFVYSVARARSQSEAS